MYNCTAPGCWYGIRETDGDETRDANVGDRGTSPKLLGGTTNDNDGEAGLIVVAMANNADPYKSRSMR